MAPREGTSNTMKALDKGLELFFPVLSLEIIVQVFGLEMKFHIIDLFTHTLTTNTLIHCANTLAYSKKSFKDLEF